MIEKHYDSDWAKAKSRDLLKQMIDKTLLTFRKPSQLKVLCLPGIDAVEIFQVYDQLGIPRENIIGVEREKDIAREIERKKLGIQVVNNTLEDYVNSQEKIDLDIVSLDYTGTFSGSQFMTANKIFRKLARNHVVFHQANLVKRDRAAYDLFGLGYVLDDVHRPLSSRNVRLGDTFDQLTRGQKIISEKVRLKEDIVDERSKAYTGCLFGTMAPVDKDQSNFIKYVVGSHSKAFLDKLYRETKDKYGKPDLSLLGSEDLANIQDLINKFFPHLCIKHGLIERNLQFNLLKALALVGMAGRPFYSNQGEKYSYISESGSPMMGDIHFCSFPERAMERAGDLVSYLGYPTKFEVRDFNRIRKLTYEFSKEWAKGDNMKVYGQDRIFLGSSAKPVITKEKAIEEFSLGSTVEDVQRKYRGWSAKPLSQWKAHVTMGTYGEKTPIATENIDSDSTLEKITLEEAKDLLASGIPPREINEAWPTSFTVGQLAAYKAHQTMGTYKK